MSTKSNPKGNSNWTLMSTCNFTLNIDFLRKVLEVIKKAIHGRLHWEIDYDLPEVPSHVEFGKTQKIFDRSQSLFLGTWLQVCSKLLRNEQGIMFVKCTLHSDSRKINCMWKLIYLVKFVFCGLNAFCCNKKIEKVQVLPVKLQKSIKD